MESQSENTESHQEDSTTQATETDVCSEPSMKKAKLVGSSVGISKTEIEKLETRLNSILCCKVCLDLPSKTVFQCPNGHLMCAGCFTHLLADARLKDEQCTCPNCRVDINRNVCSRNLAVEKAVSELPTQCQFCLEELPRYLLESHEKSQCQERATACAFKLLGCTWRGPFHEKDQHETQCSHPHKTGLEIMDTLATVNKKHHDEIAQLQEVIDLLSYEKISTNDLQLKPYRSDDFIPQLYYESSRFTSLGQQWVIKGKVVGSEQNVNRSLEYQLILKSKCKVDVKFTVIQSPYGEIKLQPAIRYHEFNSEKTESDYYGLSLKERNDCNKILAAKVIHVRLLMFQVDK